MLYILRVFLSCTCRCSDVKVRLSQSELRAFELFVSGRHEAGLVDSDSDSENFSCPCGKTFKKKASYQRHMDIFHSDNQTVSYICNVCGKTFGEKCTLTMHMSIHEPSKKAFDTMERPSTQIQNRSVSSESSSPLQLTKSDIGKVVNKTNTVQPVIQSSPKDRLSAKTEKHCNSSSSRESCLRKTVSVPSDSTEAVQALRVKDQIKASTSESLEATSVNNNNIQKSISSDICQDLCNNNNKLIQSFTTESVSGQLTDKLPKLTCSSSQDSDKENGEQTVKSEIQSTDHCENELKSGISVSKQSSDSVSLVPKERVSKVAVVKNTDHHPPQKQNTQTIVIVIREAKRVKSSDSSASAFSTDKMNLAQANTSLAASQMLQYSSTQTNTSSVPNRVIASQPLRVVSHPIQVLDAHKGTLNAVKTSPSQILVNASGTKGVSENNNVINIPIKVTQGKPNVVRNVASVAPSIVTTAPPQSMHVVKPVKDEPPEVSSTDSDLSHFSDTTESDDCVEDMEYAPIRKSARLDGKVPGWKKMLSKGCETGMPEPRQRKRKVVRPKVEDFNEIDDGELSGAAEELFGNVAAEMDIDDQEIQDMSSSIFTRQNRMYKDDYPCDICGKSFSTEKYLQMHSSLHGASTPARNLVAENFKVNDVRNVDGYRSTWTCKICNKAFAQNSSFKNHMRTHSDERPFVCDICSIGFKERYHLKKHMLFKHSDELKEKCQFCGKRFKDSTAVRAHERIHSDHRPYHCRRCGKAFKTSECLWHHENRSKTCGALGGPPLPPLPKKGRISRKSKLQPQLDEPALSDITSIELKKEEDSMLDLVEQIIHADRSEEQAYKMEHYHGLTGSNATTSHYNMPLQNSQNNSISMANGIGIAKVATGNVSQAYVHPPNNFSTSKPGTRSEVVQDMPKTVPSPQANTVKLPHGQQLVFSVPVLKDGNMDPAAQVTKAILDAISNTTGHLKGNVNIQKTIQCAVNNVQEAFDSNKQVQSQTGGVGQPKVAIPIVKTENGHYAAVVPNVNHKIHLPKSVSQPSQQQEDVKPPQPVFVKNLGLNNTFPDNASTNAVSVQPHGLQQQTSSTNRPYTVSILPPIASVAQALQPQIKSEKEDPTEEEYSTDSGDDDDMDEDSIPPINQVKHAENKILVPASSSRPVAAVQPVRRVDSEMKGVVEGDTNQNGVIESTQEPHICQPAKTKQSNYTCPKCQKGFAVLSAFQKHLLKHEEVRPFRCNTCDIGFKLKVHLKKHNLYRHSLDYPCECSICGKRFKDSSAVRLHERIHSEDRPFECGCGKSFKTKENLWGHQNRKMCPYAGYPPPSQDVQDIEIKQENPVQAHAVLEGDGITASASVKSMQNEIIAEAKVSNSKVTAQATIGKNGELKATVHPSRFVASSPENNFSAIATSQMTDHKAILKTENGEIHCRVSLPSSTASSQLPAFETFAEPSRASVKQNLVMSNGSAMSLPLDGSIHIKKESIADQCPTIQNLLKRGPRSVTKLPGIQQLFKQHIKPPPPYPGHVTPPHYSDGSSHSSGSPISSPSHGIPPSSPLSNVYSHQNSSPEATSPNLNMMLNPDQLYTTISRDPFLRTPPPPLYSKSAESYGSPSEYSLTMSGTPKSPRMSTAVSPAPSGCGDNNVPIVYWDDESDRKPVVAQWQQTDSDTLFHELSSSMINQL